MVQAHGEHLSYRHFKLTTSRNVDLTSGGKHRPLLSMYIKHYAIKRKAPLAPLFLKKGSKSFVRPVQLLLYGKPQGLRTDKTSASQRPAFTLWFTRNVE